jgi:hypothetical protein
MKVRMLTELGVIFPNKLVRRKYAMICIHT